MRRLLRLALLALVIARGASAQVPERQQRWLEDEVGGIISDYERAAFAALADNRARSEFIASFWEARDPTPQTRDNERKSQYDGWVKQADERFQVDRKSFGRVTIRGRVFVQLGPPRERLLYVPGPNLPPIEDWLYDGVSPGLGLPRAFHLIFHRPRPTADYVLYDPIVDGPEALAGNELSTASLGGGAGRVEALRRLTALSPELASAALSLIPWQPGDPATGEASAGSHSLVEAVVDLPNRLPVDLSYVGRVLGGAGGRVPVTVGFDTLPVGLTFYGALGEDGSVANFVLESPVGYPRLTAAESGRLDGGLSVGGRVTVADSPAVAMYLDEQVELSLSAESYAKVRSFPLAVEDVLAMQPGNYRAQCVIRDRVSGRFGFAESTFEVPEPNVGRLGLSPLLVVSRVVPASGSGERPFLFGADVLYPAIGNRVTAGGELVLALEVSYAADRHVDGDQLALRYEISAADQERLAGFASVIVKPSMDGGVARQILRIGLRGLEAGTYEVRTSVRDGQASATRAVPVTVADEVARAHPVIYVRNQPRGPEHRALSLARQSLSTGIGDARAALERTLSYAVEPALNQRVRLLLAAAELAASEPARVLIELQPLLAAPPVTRAAALRQIAAAYSALGAHEDAARALTDLLALSPNSTLALNSLADAASALGDEARAAAALRRSLESDPEQKGIAARLRVFERSLAAAGASPPAR